MSPPDRHPESLPGNIRHALDLLRKRMARKRALEGFSLAALAGLVLFALAMASDRVLFLSPAVRQGLTWGVCGVTGLAALWAAARLLAVPGRLPLAWTLERNRPELEESLVSSVEIASLPRTEREAFSRDLLERLYLEAGRSAEQVDLDRIAPLRRGLTLFLLSAAAWGATAVSIWTDTLATGRLAARFVHPTMDLPRPSTVRLSVHPGDAVAARGEAVEITARVLHGRVTRAALRWRLGGAPWSEGAMQSTPQAAVAHTLVFCRKLPALDEDLEYQVLAGDYLSHVYTIKARDPPRPLSFRLTYDYPRATGRPSDEVTSRTGELTAVRGTTVDLEVTASEPLASARIEGLSPGPLRLAVRGERAGARGVLLQKGGRYRLYLEDRDDVSSGGRDEYTVRVLSDRPPQIEFLEPGDAEITVDRSARLDVRFKASDDMGLRSVDLLVARLDGQEEIPLWPGGEAAWRPARRSIAQGTLLDVRGLQLEPGEEATLVLRARDGPGHETLSAPRTLRAAFVPPPPEGPGWPAPLRRIDQELAAIALKWGELPLVGGAAEPPRTLAADPAVAENLERLAAESISVQTFLRAAGRAATQAGRAVALRCAAQEDLENLGRFLRRTARREGFLFWKEALAAAGRVRERLAAADTSTEREPVPAGALAAAGVAMRSRLEDARALSSTLLAAQENEELVERSLAFLWDAENTLDAVEASGAAGGFSGRAAADRLKDLRHEAMAIAAGLAAGPPPVAALSGDVLESVAGEIDTTAGGAAARESLQRATRSMREHARRLRKLLSRARREAAEAATALAREGLGQDTLAVLASKLEAADEDASPRILEELAAEVREELDAVSGRTYVDIPTTIELTALLEIVQQLAGEPPGKRAPLAAEIRKACEATAPSRALGRVLEGLHALAHSEQKLAWKMRSASTPGFRAQQSFRRLQEDIARTAETLTARLAAVRRRLGAAGDPSSASTPAAIDRELSALSGAADGFARIARALAAPDRWLLGEAGAAPEGAGRPAPLRTLLASSTERKLLSDTAAAGARTLEGCIERLERLREDSLAGASAARAWLRARSGTISQRIDRLAGREEEIAGRAKKLATEAPDASGDPRARRLRIEQEALRRRVLAVAEAARRNGATGEGGPSVDLLRARDAAASKLAALDATTLRAAGEALRAAAAAGSAERAGRLLEAATRALDAARQLREIAAALGAIETEATLRASQEILEKLLASTASPDAAGAARDPDRLAEEARRLLEGTLRASAKLAARTGKAGRSDALLRLLAEAAALFRKALDAAGRRESREAAGALAAGKERLARAVALSRTLRGEAAPELARARKALEASSGAQEDNPQAQAAARERQQAAEDLRKLLAAEALQQQIARLFRQILGEVDPSVAKVRKLSDLEREAAKDLQDNFVTAAEIVELVSRLVKVDREGREISALERSLAARAESLAGARNQTARRELRGGQLGAVRRTRELMGEFHDAGMKISALLPLVFQAFWKARARAEAATAAVRDAAGALQEPPAPREGAQAPGTSEQRGALRPAAAKLLAGAEKMDAFLAEVGEMRGEALRALTDLERGESSMNAAQLELEQARMRMEDSLRLLERGDRAGASLAQAASMRSIAGARASLETRMRVLSAAAAAGDSPPRLAARDAATAEAWEILTRGEDPQNAVRYVMSGREMPFPARFRKLVQAYLRAIRTGGR